MQFPIWTFKGFSPGQGSPFFWRKEMIYELKVMHSDSPQAGFIFVTSEVKRIMDRLELEFRNLGCGCPRARMSKILAAAIAHDAHTVLVGKYTISLTAT
jgi:hypothetical protein